MPIYWIVLLLVGIAAGAMGLVNERADAHSKAADLSSIAHNMLIYRNALAEYAHGNQSAVGPVADAALALPSWYIRLPGISGYIASGSSYTYYASPPQGLVRELVTITGTSQAVGYVVNGQLVSPSGGMIGVSVPGVVHNGSAVAFQ
ncbi:type IV pilus biogenesis protein PilM [Pseudomonas sp. NPDC088368]|uniref:type IV pilus biogenesis protein PilM n=1 Tax=Pseudomonas sp. NPDC088368 TaxID=3364453 RepID=UPI0037FBA708